MALTIPGYEGMLGLDLKSGVDRLNAFLDTTFRQTDANAFGKDSMRAFFLMSDLPGRVRVLNTIITNMIINEIHPILVEVLPLIPTEELEFRNTVIRQEQALLEHRPEQAPSRQTRESFQVNVSKMMRYGRGAFFTVDVANTNEGRVQISAKMVQFVAQAQRTFAMIALNWLLMDRNAQSMLGVAPSYASRYQYMQSLREEIDNFCLGNKSPNGLMQLTTLGAKVIERRTGKAATHFILPPLKADAVMKNNPMYTSYDKAGAEGPLRFNSALQSQLTIHGIRLLEAPDFALYSQIQVQSMQHRATIGRYEPVQWTEMQDPRKMPGTYIFDANISNYVWIGLDELFIHSGRFVPAPAPNTGKFRFNIEALRPILTAASLADETHQPDPFLVWDDTPADLDERRWVLAPWLTVSPGYLLAVRNEKEAVYGADGAGGLNHVYNDRKRLTKEAKDDMDEVKANAASSDEEIQDAENAFNIANVDERTARIALDNGKVRLKAAEEAQRFADVAARRIGNAGAPDPLLEILATFSVDEWLRVDPSTGHAVDEYKMFAGLCFRPFESYMTDSGIIVRGGRELGLVGHSPELTEIGRDTGTGTQTLEYSVFAGAFVADWNLVHVIPNVFYARTMYGGGHLFLNQGMSNNLITRDKFRFHSPEDPCMYALLFPRLVQKQGITKTWLSTIDDVLFLHGNSPYDHLTGNPLDSYPGAHFYSTYFKWGMQPRTNSKRDALPMALYLCQGSYKIQIPGGLYHVEGRTHHGPQEDARSAEIRTKGYGIVQ